jgi:hypothetical protein
MTIHNVEAFICGLWDWAILDGCWGGSRIRPTDIDGLVERNGRFLYLEAKAPGVPLKLGQEITFQSLARNPANTVVIFWGNAATGRIERIRVLYSGSQRDLARPSLAELRRVVRDWYVRADRAVANGQARLRPAGGEG